MSKAILTIDMPNRCEECPCYQPEMNYETVEYHFCGVDGHVVSRNDLPKYDSCPLKPMPKKAEVGEIRKVDDFMKTEIQQTLDGISANIFLQTELLIAMGYNLCIDDILEGEEE